MAKAVLTLENATKLLNFAMYKNPLFAGTAVLSGLVAFAVHINSDAKATKAFEEELTKVDDTINKLESDTNKYIGVLSSLEGETNLTKEQQEQLKEATNALVTLYPELSAYIDTTTGVMAINSGQVRGLTADYIKLAKAMELTELVKTKTAQRAKAQESIEAIEAKPKSAYASGRVPVPVVKSALKLPSQNKIEQLDKEIAELNGQIDKLNSTPVEPGSTAPTPTARPSVGGGGKSGKTASKQRQDDYKAEVDQYHKYSQALKDVNSLLEENNRIYGDTDVIEDQIKLLQQRNELLMQESDITKELAKAKYKELNDEIYRLNQLGYSVEYNKETNELLINNYNQLNKAVGENARKQEKMIGNAISLADEIRKLNQDIGDNTSQIAKNNKEIDKIAWDKKAKEQKKYFEDSLKMLEKQQEAMEKIIDLTVDMIKKEMELQKESLREQLDGYQKIIDAKKEALKDEQDERYYERGLGERQKKVSDLEAELAQLQFDTSAEGTAKRLKLEEELAKAREELGDYQYDKGIEKQEEALDKELENFKDNIDSQIKEIDEALSKEGYLRQQAMKLIEKNNKELYDKLLKYNAEYGTGVREDITDAWGLATSALEKYNDGQLDVLETFRQIAQEMNNMNMGLEGIAGTDKPPSSGMGTPSKSQQQLNQQKYLHDLMVKAQAEGNTGLQQWIIAERKKWGMSADGTIVEQFHNGAEGGFVGGINPSLKSNEVFAKLMKGELVVNSSQMDSFMKNTLPQITEINNGVNGGVSFGSLINVQGNVDQAVMPQLEKMVNTAIKDLTDTMFRRGYTRSPNTFNI